MVGFEDIARAASPFLMSRTVQKTLAPVAAIALAVSMPANSSVRFYEGSGSLVLPMPDEHPVMRTTLSASFPSKPSSFTIWRAVGRSSSGPAGFAWAAAYREGITQLVEKHGLRGWRLIRDLRSTKAGMDGARRRKRAAADG